MGLFALGFLAGDGLLFLLPGVPPLPWALLLAAGAGAGLWRWPRGRLLWAAALGLVWGALRIGPWLDTVLDPRLERVDLVVTGRVVGIPRAEAHRLRFRFRPEQWRTADGASLAGHALPDTLLLSWYEGHPVLRPGERWRLAVRLKRPHGRLNPGGFDYQRWLFRAGIGATGYVRRRPPAARLAAAGPTLDGLRLHLAGRLRAVLGEGPGPALVLALALGLRDDIPPALWQTLLSTGTNHLVAISGLHVGLAAALGYWAVRGLWWLWPALALRWPAQRAAALGALPPALAYAALAGFSLPTQRALVMLAAGLGWLLLARRARLGHALSLALLVVLLLDVRAPLSAAFWLSFAAVAFILALAAGGHLSGPRWRAVTGLQLALSLALLPLTLLLFGQGSLVAPLANLLAVPVVTLLAVPLVLLGTLLLLPWPALGAPLLHGAAALLDALQAALAWLAACPGAQLADVTLSWPAALLALAGVGLLLAPRGWPGRPLAVLLFLPALLPGRAPLPAGAFRADFLDVGQGLAVVVTTRSHVLLFDTGPAWRGHSLAAREVLPFLRRQGVRALDALVLSHADSDHAGGRADLEAALPVRAAWASFAVAGSRLAWRRCAAPTAWRWDGVDFRFLNAPPRAGESENDAACVLQVRGPGGSLLLTSDIERRAEQALLARYGGGLRSTVMALPHHGSETSSTPAFLDAVGPAVAVASVGYRNRWGFPRPAVLARYRARGVRVLRTDRDGAVRIEFPPQGPPRATGRRGAHPRLWHALTGRQF